MGDRAYSFDAGMLLSDNSAAYSASGYSTVGGAPVVLDLGGNQSTTPKQQARIDAAVVVDVTAIKISAGDEAYKMIVVGSNDPGLATGNQIVGEIMVGKGTALDALASADGVVGRYEILVALEQVNTKYQYVGLYLVVAGTLPSISFQAFVAVLPEP